MSETEVADDGEISCESASSDATPPNPVDLHVGAQVRARRKELGVSQAALASELGLTFQQVQKYERGANRVSASKLYDIARVLQTTIQSFYEGLASPIDMESPLAPTPVVAHPATPEPSAELKELVALLGNMPAPRRKLILKLARALAGDEPVNF